MHIRFKNKFEKSESWCPDIFMITKIIIIVLKKKKTPYTNKQTKLKKPTPGNETPGSEINPLNNLL